MLPDVAATRRAAHCFRTCRRYNAAEAARRAARVRSTAIFISPAYAQAAGASLGGYDQIIQFLFPLGLIVIIMYFLVIRPQQRVAREKSDLLKNIRRGDTVTTAGGLIGKVTKVVDDAELEVEIAQNVRVRVARLMVADVRAKGEPVKAVEAKGTGT